MTLTEMHVMFRQFAQQMGLQNVRAILPEQIDLLLNTSISDTVNQIIQQNIGITNDRIVTDNSKIGQINALRTLYKTKELTFTQVSSTGLYKVYTYGGSQTNVTAGEQTAGEAGSATPRNTSDLGGSTNNFGDTPINPLFWVDFSISYNVGTNASGNITTHWFPVRIIDDMYLADVLNDFVLKPTLRSPVITMINGKAELYIGDLKSDQSINTVRASYVDKPTKVQYLQDIGGNNVGCDLPDHLHVDIVKHAVELWQISLQGNMATEQARLQRAQNERARNTNRSEND